MPAENWKEIILDIKRSIGPYFARFYGGEPFVYKNLVSLISFCTEQGIPSFITTNGTMITKQIARELSACNILTVNISLDGSTADKHDSLRGIPGTFDKIMQAIVLLKTFNIPIQLNATIMNDTIDDVLALAHFAKKYKVSISFQGVSDTVYRNPRKSHEGVESMFPKDLKKMERVLADLVVEKKNNPYISNSVEHIRRLQVYFKNPELLTKKYCEALARQIMVKDQGDVYLCSFSGLALESIGTVRDYSFADVWRSQKAKNVRDKMMQCHNLECLAIRGCYEERFSEKFEKLSRCFFRS